MEPEFILTDDANGKTLALLNEADREVFRRGVDLKT